MLGLAKYSRGRITETLVVLMNETYSLSTDQQFDAKDPEVQCKGCMTCRKVTPTFMKRVETQVV